MGFHFYQMVVPTIICEVYHCPVFHRNLRATIFDILKYRFHSWAILLKGRFQRFIPFTIPNFVRPKTFDIYKCFDQIVRQVIYALAREAGMPSDVLQTYKAFIEQMTIMMQVGNTLGVEHRHRCSIPQGCPFSMALSRSLCKRSLARAGAGVTHMPLLIWSGRRRRGRGGTFQQSWAGINGHHPCHTISPESACSLS